MKAILLRAVAVAAAAGLALAIGIEVRPSAVNAQAMSSMAPVPAVECTDGWLKSAMGRLATASSGMTYSGNVDKDAGSAMMIIKRAESQAAAWEAKCGKNEKMKAMAASMKTKADQDMTALAATTQTTY